MAFDLFELASRQLLHLVAGMLRVFAHLQKARDFLERKIHGFRPLYEAQPGKVPVIINPRAGGGARHRPQQPDLFVITKRVCAEAGQAGYIANPVAGALSGFARLFLGGTALKLGR